MMSLNISQRDWQLISEYVDGQLSEREGARLEARLRVEPDLSEALTSLRRTRAVIRSVPKRRVPRNFMLTPAMVGQETPRSFGLRLQSIFALRLTSALASFLLVITLVGNLMMTRVPMFSARESEAQVAMAPVTEEAFAVGLAQESMPAEKMPPPGEPQATEGSAKLAAPVETEAPPEALAMAPQVTATPEVNIVSVVTETPGLPTPGAQDMAPNIPGSEEQPLVGVSPSAPDESPSRLVGTVHPAATATPTPQLTKVVEMPPPSPASTDTVIQAETLIQDEPTPEVVAPSPQEDATGPAQLTTDGETGQSEVSPGDSWLGLRLFQLALGLVALIAAIGAIYLARRST